MTVSDSLKSLLEGFRLTLSEPSVRKLALLPWLISLGLYPLSLFAAFYLHPYLLAMVASPADTFWASVYYTVMWAVVGLASLVGSVILSFILLITMLSLIQEPIARKVLEIYGAQIPASSGGVIAETKNLSYSMLRALALLICLAPILLASLILSLIPIFAPVGLLLAAWIIAVQCFDPVHEVMQVPLRERFRNALRNKLAYAAFGGTILALGLIPLVGIAIAPIAVAGAAKQVASLAKVLPQS
jgi:uncharacterized protein involved in cysteine biosynthesis